MPAVFAAAKLGLARCACATDDREAARALARQARARLGPEPTPDLAEPVSVLDAFLADPCAPKDEPR